MTAPRHALAPVDATAFRSALGRWASGVTIVTAAGPDGPVGLTASSFSSLSLHPPLVLVCIAHSGSSHDPVITADGFAVHMLGEADRGLSATFALQGADKFGDIPWSLGASGVPLLDTGIARLVCLRESVLDGGDHSILIGRVAEVDLREGRPLLYWMGGYRELAAAPRPGADGGVPRRAP